MVKYGNLWAIVAFSILFPYLTHPQDGVLCGWLWVQKNLKALFCGLLRLFASSCEGIYGAGERIRTSDLRITNALLYQLSYTGTLFIFEAFISRRDAHFTELFEKCKSAIKFFRPSSDSVFFEADSGEKTRTSDLRITSI